MCARGVRRGPLECLRGLQRSMAGTGALSQGLMGERFEAARAEQKRGAEANRGGACSCTRGVLCSPLSLCGGCRQFARCSCILMGAQYEAAHAEQRQRVR